MKVRTTLIYMTWYAELDESSVDIELGAAFMARHMADPVIRPSRRHACCSYYTPLMGQYISADSCWLHISAFIILFTFDEAISYIDC